MTEYPLVKYVRDGNGRLLALVVSGWRGQYDAGVKFFTSPELSMQLGWMRHPAGKVIPAHVHPQETRQVLGTAEVLFVQKGRLEVSLYGDGWEVQKEVLGAGDVVVLLAGGHGFKVLEEVEAFEVKQGPYLGDKDKVRVEEGAHEC